MAIVLTLVPAIVLATIAAICIDNFLVYIIWHLMAGYLLADWWIFLNHE